MCLISRAETERTTKVWQRYASSRSGSTKGQYSAILLHFPLPTHNATGCGETLTRELVRLYVSVFVASLGAGLYVYFIPLYAQKFGASFLDLGFIGTAYAVTYAMGPIFAGYIADKVNRAWLYSLGITLIALVTITLTLVRSVADIVILRSSAGLAFAFFWPTSEVLVADLASEENRLKEMGVYSVFWCSGFLIGPMLGGLILQAYSYTWLFLTSFVLITCALVMAVAWVVPRHTRRNRHNPIADFTGSFSIMKSLTSWYMVILCYGIITSVLTSIFPGYANLVGIDPALIGILFSAYSLARIFIYAVVGRLQYFGETRVLLAVSAVFGAGILCIGILPGFDGFLLGLVLMGCCSGAMFPLMINLISRHFPAEKLGVAVGSYEAVFGLGSVMGPILAGSLASFGSARWAFVLFSLFGAVMFLFVTIGKSLQS
ncbi:MAG: MFS transporter [Candidatus Bathyarchaeia archaeon]